MTQRLSHPYVVHMAQTDVVGQLGTFVAEPSRILHRLMSILDLTDADLALRLEVSRQTVHSRRTGRTQMSLDNIRETAEALEVEPLVFLGTELEAMRWIIENKPELFRCLVA